MIDTLWFFPQIPSHCLIVFQFFLAKISSLNTGFRSYNFYSYLVRLLVLRLWMMYLPPHQCLGGSSHLGEMKVNCANKWAYWIRDWQRASDLFVSQICPSDLDSQNNTFVLNRVTNSGRLLDSRVAMPCHTTETALKSYTWKLLKTTARMLSHHQRSEHEVPIYSCHFTSASPPSSGVLTLSNLEKLYQLS